MSTSASRYAERKRKYLELRQQLRKGKISYKEFVYEGQQLGLIPQDKPSAGFYEEAVPKLKAQAQAKAQAQEYKPIFTTETIQAQRNPQSVDTKRYFETNNSGQITGPKGYGVSSAFSPRLTPSQVTQLTTESAIKEQKNTRYVSVKPVNTDDHSSISPGFAKRIDFYLKGEERVDTLTSKTIDFLGLDRKRSDNVVVEQAKAFGRIGVGIVPNLTKVVFSRVPFAVEASFTKLGRQEVFKDAPKRVLPALATTYDYKTAEGRASIALTVLAIKHTAGALKAAKTQPSYVKGETITTRITSKGLVADKSAVKVTAMIGSKSKTFTGTLEQMYIKGSKSKYMVKGTGQVLQQGSKTKTIIDTRGVALQKKGGFDVTTLSKMQSKTGVKTSTQMYLDITKTAKLNRPETAFRSYSRMGTVAKGRPLTEVRAAQATGSYTTTLSVRDLFNPKKNLFTKPIKTESGKVVGVQQTLVTDSRGVSAKVFNKYYTTTGRPDLSRTLVERKAFRPVYETPQPKQSTAVTSGRSGLVSVSRTQFVSKPLPDSSNILLNLTKQAAAKAFTSAKTATVATKGATAVSLIPRTVSKPATATSSLYRVMPSLSTRSTSSLASMLGSMSMSGVKPTVKPAFAAKTASQTKPMLSSMTKTTGATSASLFGGYAFGGSAARMPALPSVYSKTSKKSKSSSPFKDLTQPKAYTPSGRAAAFGLRGRTMKGSIISGLGERYILSPKKRRKSKR
jgi:hypothetical protein